jgi:hypothetical protein
LAADAATATTVPARKGKLKTDVKVVDACIDWFYVEIARLRFPAAPEREWGMDRKLMDWCIDRKGADVVRAVITSWLEYRRRPTTETLLPRTISIKQFRIAFDQAFQKWNMARPASARQDGTPGVYWDREACNFKPVPAGMRWDRQAGRLVPLALGNALPDGRL